MRRIITCIILLVLLTNMFAVTIEFTDNNKVDCEIVGKQNGSMYLHYNDVVYRVKQDNIKAILVEGADFKSLEFRRNDWILQTIDMNKVVDYDLEKNVIKSDSKPSSLKTFENMSDREFQVYLAQMNVNAMDKSSTKISKTIWGVFWTSMAISAIGVGIIAGAN